VAFSKFDAANVLLTLSKPHSSAFTLRHAMNNTHNALLTLSKPHSSALTLRHAMNNTHNATVSKLLVGI
jgi:hypothetical protein